MPRLDGPFEILEKIDPNGYKVDVPGEYGVSATSNVTDLSPYYAESEEISSLRSNSHQAGQDDGDHHTKSPKMLRKSRRSKKLLRMSREFILWLETSYFKPEISCPVHPKTARFLCIF